MILLKITQGSFNELSGKFKNLRNNIGEQIPLHGAYVFCIFEDDGGMFAVWLVKHSNQDKENLLNALNQVKTTYGEPVGLVSVNNGYRPEVELAALNIEQIELSSSENASKQYFLTNTHAIEVPEGANPEEVSMLMDIVRKQYGEPSEPVHATQCKSVIQKVFALLSIF